MKNDNHLVAIIKRHFQPSMHMLTLVIDKCPVELWTSNKYGLPIWKRVLHTLESLDYWLNEFGPYYFDTLGKDISAEFNVTDKDTLSQAEMKNYTHLIVNKCHRFFNHMNDLLILTQSTHKSHTYMDVILTQIRHIQLNIGYCNNCFNQHGIGGVQWCGYAEE